MTADPSEVAVALRKLAVAYDKADPAKTERYREAAKLHDEVANAKARKPT